MKQWYLFNRANGRIGILPEEGKHLIKGDIIELVSGTFADACDRADAIEQERRENK